MKDLAEIKYLMLDIINNSDNPIGAVKLKKVLAAKDIKISEATVGRILSELDSIGYTKKEGSSGRILTDDGINKLIENQYIFKSKEHYNDIISLINKTGLEDMLNYLNAREGVELQSITLAIANATKEDIKNLHSILLQEMEVFSNYVNKKPTVNQGYLDYQFHHYIVKTAKNPFLEAFYGILTCSGQIQQIYKFITIQEYIEEHLKIFEGIRDKNVELAHKELRKHFDSVRKECILYWKNKALYEKYLQQDKKTLNEYDSDN
jgi:hypothetical protein